MLRDLFLDDPRAVAIAEAVAADRALTIGACHGAAPALLIAAALARGAQRPVVVAHDPATLAEDLNELGVAAAVLPELDRHEDDSVEVGISGHQRRLAALEAFSSGSVLIATPASVEQPVPDLAAVTKGSLILRKGQTHDLAALVDRLSESSYRTVAVVEAQGQMAVRGGILDVFPFLGGEALRIEFFGDSVDGIRRFDPFSQESTGVADEAVLAVATTGLAALRLFDQVPAGPLLVIGDTPLAPRLRSPHGRAEIRLARALEAGMVDAQTTGIERLRGDMRKGLPELALIMREQPETTVLVLCRSEEAVTEHRQALAEAGIAGTAEFGRLSAGVRDLERGRIVVHDFELAERRPVRRRAGAPASSPLSSWSDLRRGDLCVHLQHGVCIFRGLATLEKRGFREDFLLLEFAESSKLYVPVEMIEQVQRFVGAGGRDPELAKLGGAAWAKKRAKAKKAIEDMSGELLAAQAARLARGGIAMGGEAAMLRRFESSFPHEETADQLAAVREIKADMGRAIAMDRLLCGDVGFGKTEVAMRAAAVAVSAGYQVAVLAPTTLLAEQHLETFQARFAPSGVRVEGLNRFNDAKERRATVAGAADGSVQVVVGTHAILSETLQFQKLGLLVVDEEHRFGVKQKERLKQLRDAGAAPAHVLALSATPIPRTLHFSLLGIRDISVLAEAPAERMAVETRVLPWDDHTVRTALARERERSGQVFVVHHRIEELDRIAHKLVQLAPGLKVDAIHGQMDQERIARVMDAFRTGRLECLVSTSIVESGIDIPNANTLLVTNAQSFGLAELHQLRGRIGRFTRQAYAYFLTPPHRDIGEEARERLNAIQEYAELGAGFKLAMRDLELRGAGNLLGGEQSGHIDAIGYELYTSMLAEAVAQAKTAAGIAPATPSPKPSADAHQVLSLPMDAYIPDDWLDAPQLKFELHKSIDGARRLSDLQRAMRSARDRFGAFPDPVRRLVRLKAIRLAARELRIARIEPGDRRFRLSFDGPIPQQLIQAKLPELVHVQPEGKAVVLFVRPTLTPDITLDLLGRLLGVPEW